MQFREPQLLTVTIPDYTGIWQVETGEDGLLYDENGESYGFLFYESVTQAALFQREEGFFIPGNDRKKAYEKILAAYGFQETEIRDFVEFWTGKLPEGVDYMMYPQLTDTVDIAMPMTVSPTPEKLVRMWFVFEACGEQVKPEPEVEAFERADYTVVEWGGVILGE